MKRLILTGAFLLSTISGYALSLLGGNYEIELATGWRQDTLNFNASGPDGVPNVAQQRNWKDIRSWDVGGKLDYEWCQILLRGYGDYGKIYEGNSSIKTWAGEDRTGLSDHLVAEADRGEVFDYGVALGYRLPYCLYNQHFVFTPLLGWSQHEQHLQQLHGNDLLAPGAGAITDMHNDYQTRWYGPWLGYEFRYCLPCNMSLTQGFQWHWAKFRAHGKDHERPFTDSSAIRAKYKQSDHAHDYLVSLGLDYMLNRCWTIGVFSYYQQMQCHNGHQSSTVTLPAASAGTTTATLNRVYWHTFSVLANISYGF